MPAISQTSRFQVMGCRASRRDAGGAGLRIGPIRGWTRYVVLDGLSSERGAAGRPGVTYVMRDTMAKKESLLSLRQILIKRRDALRRALAGDLSLLKELRGQSTGDVIDAALDSAQDELSSQIAEVESRELSNIETALERMRQGEYGRCDGCGNGIPLARLQALPYATMCIQCQREAEKNGDVVGGANLSRIFDGGLGDSDVSTGDLEIDVS